MAESGAQVKCMRINCATLRAMPSALKGLISAAVAKPKGTLNLYNDGDKDVGPRATMNILCKKGYENKWQIIVSERSRTHEARTNAQSCVWRVNTFAPTCPEFIVYDISLANKEYTT